MSLRDILARFDIGVTGTDKLKDADKGVSGLEKKLTGLGDALAGAAIVQGFRGMIGELVDTAGALDDTSQRLGINVVDLQRWQFAAKLSGVEAGAFAAGLKKLQLNVADGKPIFAKLGVSIKDANGELRETPAILGDTLRAIASLPEGAERTSALVDALGKAGSDLGPMLSEGAEGLNDLLAELDKAGGGLTEDAIAQLAELGDNGDRFEQSLLSLKGALASQFLPWMNKTITTMSSYVVAIKNSPAALNVLKGVLVAVGAVGVAMAANLLAAWAPLGIAILGIGLIVEDLIGGMAGKTSAIGRLLDEIGGEGTSKEFFNWLRDTLNEIKEFAQDVVNSIKNIKSLGEDFSGKGRVGGQSFAAEQVNRTLSKFVGDQDPIDAMIEAEGEGTSRRKTRLQADQTIKRAQIGFNQYGDEKYQALALSVARERAARGDDLSNRAGLVPIRSGMVTEGIKQAQGQPFVPFTLEDTIESLSKELAGYAKEGLRANESLGELTNPANRWAEGKINAATQTIQVTNQNTFNIEAASGDAQDIADATGGAVNTANAGALQTLEATARKLTQ